MRASQQQWFGGSGLLVLGLLEATMQKVGDWKMQVTNWAAENASDTTGFVINALESKLNEMIADFENEY